MPEEPADRPARGLSESLRTAVERTFAATADSAAEAGERAQGLLDEVVRRGQEAQEASAGVAARVVEAIEGMRLATREEVRDMRRELSELGGRLERVEERVTRLESNPKAEG